MFRKGADLSQKVEDLQRKGTCGTILWEFKQTKTWNDEWLAKIRSDNRDARASVSVIASAALPSGLVGFDRIGEVWVTSFDLVVPLARALRSTLQQAWTLQVAAHDQTNKAERMYAYTSSEAFQRRVRALVDSYIGLREELDREKRYIKTSWAKREKSHDLMIEALAALNGEICAILGESKPELEGLDFPKLAAASAGQ